jgi:dipeptidyl aminopeptidase/acylaminoacyl peptidase
VVDRARGRLLAVREDHRAGPGEPRNELVALDIGGDGADTGQALVSGNDFYASPQLSPDGSRLAWLTWNHPNMPWDGTELWLGELDARGAIATARLVAGGPRESIFQPQFSSDGVLHFVSDRSGWWNLYRREGSEPVSLARLDAEFGQPQWLFGMSTYGFAADGTIVCTYSKNGTDRLARLGHDGLQPIEVPFNRIGSLRVGEGFALFLAASPTEAPVVARLDLTSGAVERLGASSAVAVDAGYLARPEPVEFPARGGGSAYGFFYPPTNKDFVAPKDDKPPLIVVSHGGPTAQSSSALNLSLQYWTSRGFAVLDVDYGGSTGYGRAYRERLNGNWGVVDVGDCVDGALHLVREGRADGQRLAIRGWSASGYTTLAALTFRDVFKAGASHFGIGDLEALVRDTHKFESRYLDRLVCPYPERKELYVERSPIRHVDRIRAALILFQGLEDRVVPPNQARMMYEAVKAKGLPVAIVEFAGEQHGFRKAENIRRSLDGELYFLGRVFGFTPAGEIEPVEIANA